MVEADHAQCRERAVAASLRGRRRRDVGAVDCAATASCRSAVVMVDGGARRRPSGRRWCGCAGRGSGSVRARCTASTRRQLRDAPHVASVLAELAGRLDGAVFTAHNADFDAAFLERAARRDHVALPSRSHGCARCGCRASSTPTGAVTPPRRPLRPLRRRARSAARRAARRRRHRGGAAPPARRTRRRLRRDRSPRSTTRRGSGPALAGPPRRPSVAPLGGLDDLGLGARAAAAHARSHRSLATGRRRRRPSRRRRARSTSSTGSARPPTAPPAPAAASTRGIADASSEPAPRRRQRLVASARRSHRSARAPRCGRSGTCAALARAVVVGDHVPLAAVGEHLTRGDRRARSTRRGTRSSTRSRSRSMPVCRRRRPVGGGRRVDVELDPQHRRVVARRARPPAWPGRGRAGPSASAPGSSIAARPAASSANASARLSRSGRVNSRGTPTKIMPSSMNTSIISSTNGGSPHIAASSRSADDLVLGQLEPLGHLGDRHLAALHQPRQHHQQPPQPLLGGPRRARGRHAGHRARATRRRRRARRRATSTSACSSKPEHPRPERRRRLAHGTSTRRDPSAGAVDHAIVAELATDGRGARGVDADDRLRHRRRRRRRAPSGRPGRHRAQVEAGRAFERRRPADRRPRPSMRSTRNVRRSPRAWSCPITYQNPSRSSSPYGSTRAIDLAVLEVDRRRVVDRLAQHRQAGQRRHRRRRPAPSRSSTAGAELPHRLLARRPSRCASRPPPPAAPASRRSSRRGRQLVALAVDPVRGLSRRTRPPTTISCSIGTPISRERRLVAFERAALRSVLLSGYWPRSSPAICTRLSGSGVSSSSASRLVRRSTRSAINASRTRRTRGRSCGRAGRPRPSATAAAAARTAAP